MTLKQSIRGEAVRQSEIRAMTIACNKVGGINMAQGICDLEVPQVVIEEAKKAKDEAKEKVILFNWSGHGLIDLGAYDKYFAGELFNFVLTEEEILASEKAFEDFPKPQLIKSR